MQIIVETIIIEVTEYHPTADVVVTSYMLWSLFMNKISLKTRNTSKVKHVFQVIWHELQNEKFTSTSAAEQNHNLHFNNKMNFNVKL